MGKIHPQEEEQTEFTMTFLHIAVPLCPQNSTAMNCFCSSYFPLSTHASASKDHVELVNFRLTRDTNGQSPEGPQPTQNPSEKAFQSLIKDLSLGQGLEQLVSSTDTENSFRYRRYSELSGFLRALTLNFPKITSLRRYLKTANGISTKRYKTF